MSYRLPDHEYPEGPVLPLLTEHGVSSDAATSMVQLMIRAWVNGEEPVDTSRPANPKLLKEARSRARLLERALQVGTVIGDVILVRPDGRAEAQIKCTLDASGFVELIFKDYMEESHPEQGVRWARDKDGFYVPEEIPTGDLPVAQGPTLPPIAFDARLATLYDRVTTRGSDSIGPLVAKGYLQSPER